LSSLDVQISAMLLPSFNFTSRRDARGRAGQQNKDKQWGTRDVAPANIAWEN
jgi:hypothetical protein